MESYMFCPITDCKCILTQDKQRNHQETSLEVRCHYEEVQCTRCTTHNSVVTTLSHLLKL